MTDNRAFLHNMKTKQKIRLFNKNEEKQKKSSVTEHLQGKAKHKQAKAPTTFYHHVRRGKKQTHVLISDHSI